jgi:hypothetical protein
MEKKVKKTRKTKQTKQTRKKRNRRISVSVDAKTGEETFSLTLKVPSLKGSRGRPQVASKGATSRLKAARTKVEKQLEDLRKLQDKILKSSSEFTIAKQNFQDSVSSCAAKAERQAVLLADKKAKAKARKRKKKERERLAALATREKIRAKKRKDKEKAKAKKIQDAMPKVLKRRGRPPGSKNKPKDGAVLSTESPECDLQQPAPKRRGRPRKHPLLLEVADPSNKGADKGKTSKGRRKASKASKEDLEDESVLVTTYHMGSGGEKKVVKQREESVASFTESMRDNGPPAPGKHESKSSGLYQEYDKGKEPMALVMLGHCGECGGWLTDADKLSKFVVLCPFCGEKQRTSKLVSSSEEAANPRKDRYELNNDFKDNEEEDDVDVETEEDVENAEAAESLLPQLPSSDSDSDSDSDISDTGSLGDLSIEMESVVQAIHPKEDHYNEGLHPFDPENPASENYVEEEEVEAESEDEEPEEDDEGEAF